MEKRLATHLVGKWNLEYFHQMVYYVRVRMAIALSEQPPYGSSDQQQLRGPLIPNVADLDTGRPWLNLSLHWNR